MSQRRDPLARPFKFLALFLDFVQQAHGDVRVIRVVTQPLEQAIDLFLKHLYRSEEKVRCFDNIHSLVSGRVFDIRRFRRRRFFAIAHEFALKRYLKAELANSALGGVNER